MKNITWIEKIRVRSSEEALDESMSLLMDQVKDIEASSPHMESLFLQHGFYSGDFSVVLLWSSEAPNEASKEGILIAEIFNRLGPVDHSYWVPVNL